MRNNKNNFVYLNASEEEKREAKEYDAKRKKIISESTKIYNEKQNEIGYLPELCVQREFTRRGIQIFDNVKYGEGNEYDFTLIHNGIEEKHEIKCRTFKSGSPNEEWYFPLFMKEWTKMYDWHKDKQKINLMHLVGYDERKQDVIYYGFISPNELIQLYRYFNLNDELANKYRKVRYYPKGYWLGGSNAKEDGILTTLECLYPFHSLW